MAILARLDDKLRSPFGITLNPSPVEQEYEAKRQAHFERLYNYLVGDKLALKRYMQEGMKYVWKDETIGRIPMPYMNIFRRIIHRLSVVYQEPAERYLLRDTDGGRTAENPDNDKYQRLLAESNINAAAKQWNRYAKAFDTCYVKVTWMDENTPDAHVEYEVFAPHQLTVTPSDTDYLKPSRIEYKVAAGEEDETIIWTDAEHWILAENGKPRRERNPWNGENRYGVIPFYPVRLRWTEDHWGEGDTQLADINEKINILLASTYYNAILQTHGQLMTINFGLKDGEQLRLGPDSVLNVENVLTGEVTPDARYIHPDPAIDVALKQIDWMTKTAAMMRGLPASAVSIDETAQSGAAKLIDNQELMELRADDIELLRPAEKQIYRLTRTVWNYHNPGEKLSEEAVFGVDFQLPDPGQSDEDARKEKDWKYGYGLWTPVDDMADEDEGITREKAKALIQANLQVKAELFPAPTFEPKDDDDEDDGDTGQA